MAGDLGKLQKNTKNVVDTEFEIIGFAFVQFLKVQAISVLEQNFFFNFFKFKLKFFFNFF